MFYPLRRSGGLQIAGGKMNNRNGFLNLVTVFPAKATLILLLLCTLPAGLFAQFAWDGCYGLTSGQISSVDTLYETWKSMYVKKFQLPGKTLYHDQSGANLAYGAEVEVSTQRNGDSLARYAVDGNRDTSWGAHAYSAAADLTVDLGQIQELGSVVLRWTGGYAAGYSLLLSSDGENWSQAYATASGDGDVDQIQLTGNSARYLKLAANVKGGYGGYGLNEIEVYPPAVPLSLNAAAESSSVEGADFLPSAAVDGDYTTRWASAEGSDDEWLTIDLGSSRSFNRVVLNWEAAYAEGYRLEVADEQSNAEPYTYGRYYQAGDSVQYGDTVYRCLFYHYAASGWEPDQPQMWDVWTEDDTPGWREIYSLENGKGGIEYIDLNEPVEGRYLRLTGIERGAPWGYSLYEVQVYDVEPDYSYADGAIVYMKGNGDGIESGEHCTTTEAMGYGLILAAVFKEKALFDGLKLVCDTYPSLFRKTSGGGSEAQEDSDHPSGYKFIDGLTSWVIPCVDGSEGKEIYVGVPAYDKDSPEEGCYWSATDGDLDVAMGLLIRAADTQDYGLLRAAGHRMNMISKYLVAENGTFLLAADDVDAQNNPNKVKADHSRPSDWMVSHFMGFALTNGDENWRKISDASLRNLERARGSSWLVPDFTWGRGSSMDACDEDHWVEKCKVIGKDANWTYYYNACRVPWRIGMAYMHYGDERAKKYVAELGKWYKDADKHTDGEIFAGYNLDGTPHGGVTWSDELFTVCMAVALAANKDTDSGITQTDFTNILSKIDFNGLQSGDDKYFTNTIKILSLAAIGGIWTPPEYWVNEIGDDGDFDDKGDWVCDDLSVESGKGKITTGSSGTVELSHEVEIVPSMGYTINMQIRNGTGLDWKDGDWGNSWWKQAGKDIDVELTCTIGGSEKSVETTLSSCSQDNVFYFVQGVLEPIDSKVSTKTTATLTLSFDENQFDTIYLDDISLRDPPPEMERYWHVPLWEQGAVYAVGDHVKYGGRVYECAAGHEGGYANHPSAEDGTWELSTYGLLGNYWQPSRGYAQNEYVVHEGVVYRCVAAHYSAGSQPPSYDHPVWTYEYELYGLYEQDQVLASPWEYGGYYPAGTLVSYGGNVYISLYDQYGYQSPDIAHWGWQSVD